MIRFLFIISFSSTLFGQYNLVPNPSFEICTNCSSNIMEFTVPNGPQILGWNNPNSSTPDFINVSNLNLPFDTIDGTNFLGILSYQSIFNDPLPDFHDQREYIQCELIDSMVFKDVYLVDFYSLSDTNSANFLTNNIGIHFSNTPIISNNGDYINLDAQVKYYNNEVVENPYKWVKISGIYIATGGEKYLTVGNFNSDVETDFTCLSLFWPAAGRGYVFLDKFSVTPLDSIPGGLQVNAGIDQSICPGDTVFIGEKISNLPANWYMLDGTVVDTNTAGVYVHPTVTTTYVVTMTINGVYSTDTVTVTVGCAGIVEPENTSFKIGPNPNDGQFTINGQFSEGDLISIVSAEGRVVQTIHIDEQTEKQNIDLDLNPGIYLLQISTPQGNYCEKIRLE
ncbi:MAG: hypothetical protein RL164_234 [Bacteroidota bacterium]